jgi:hypothetical protein
LPIIPGLNVCKCHWEKAGIEFYKKQTHKLSHTYSVGKTKFRGERTISNYEIYLQSPEWKAKASALKKENPNCSICNRKGTLHTHHRTYVRCGKEDKFDLVVLCADCHALFHKFYIYDGAVGYFVPKGQKK